MELKKFAKAVVFIIFGFIVSTPLARPVSGQITSEENNLALIIYSHSPFYGFNSGTDRQELRFRYTQHNRLNTLFIDKFVNKQFQTIGAYTNRGLMILSLDHRGSTFSDGLTPTEFEERFSTFLSSSNLPELSTEILRQNNWMIDNTTMVFADKSGKNYIFSAEKSEIKQVEEQFPIAVATFRQPYDEIFSEETKEDFLYKKIINRLSEVYEQLDVETTIEILAEFQPLNQNQTSVVITPGNNQVYVSIGDNNEQVWRLDINGGTVETHSGFTKNHKANIPKIGITSSDLRILNFSNENLTQGIMLLSLVILLIILISTSIYFPWRIQKKDKSGKLPPE